MQIWILTTGVNYEGGDKVLDAYTDGELARAAFVTEVAKIGVPPWFRPGDVESDREDDGSLYAEISDRWVRLIRRTAIGAGQ